MNILKNKYQYQNIIKRDDKGFNEFEGMILKYFDFKEEKENIKNFMFKSIEFKRNCFIVRYKTFWWFEKAVSIKYNKLIKQIQKLLTIKYPNNNFTFGEKLDNNETNYYITADGGETFHFENSCRIDLYLDIYSKYLKD